MSCEQAPAPFFMATRTPDWPANGNDRLRHGTKTDRTDDSARPPSYRYICIKNPGFGLNFEHHWTCIDIELNAIH